MQHRVRFSLCLFSLPSTMRSFARGCLTILRTTKTKRRPAPGSSSRWFSRVFFFFVKSSDSPQSPWSHPSRAWGIINDAILLTSVGRKSLGRRKESCAWFTLSWTLRIFFLSVPPPLPLSPCFLWSQVEVENAVTCKHLELHWMAREKGWKKRFAEHFVYAAAAAAEWPLLDWTLVTRSTDNPQNEGGLL